jgi:replicative DNA helicase
MGNLSFLYKGKRKNIEEALDPSACTSIEVEAEGMIVHAMIVHTSVADTNVSEDNNIADANICMDNNNIIAGANVDTTNEGGGLLSNTAYKIFSSIETLDFTHSMNAKIFRVCKDLGFKDLSINKVNGLIDGIDPSYIEALKPNNNKDLEQLVRHFVEGAVKRRVEALKVSLNYGNMAKVESDITLQNSRITTTDISVSMKDNVQSLIEHDAHIAKHGYGLKTHISTLNYYIKGFSAGQLIIIGATTSVGKTALGMNIASHIADTHSVLFFSLEMSAVSLTSRIVLSYNGGGDKDKALDMVSVKNMDIRDDSSLSIDDIEHIALSKSSLDFMVVDYLQIMKMHKDNDLSSLQDITMRMKALARKLSIPIILISQMNRGVKNNEGMRPLMSDLRGSGSIEQDADIVLLIHRNYKNKHRILVEKNREGSTGVVEVKFDGKSTLFSAAGATVGGTTSNEKVSINDFRQKLLGGAT